MLHKKHSASRLLALAAHLDTVPTEDFDYGIWTSGVVKKLTPSCGTIGCAAAWAASMPRFNKLGLHLAVLNKDSSVSLVALSRGRGIPRLWHTEALGEVFGLDTLESDFLFRARWVYNGELSPGYRATPKDVANHIRKFVKTYRS